MDALITALKPLGILKTIKKDGNLMFQGEIPRRVIIVRSGVIRAYTITSSGDERIVALYGEGDILPLSWVIGETSNSLFYYDAISDAQVLTVAKSDFMDILEKKPDAQKQMLSYVSKQYTSLLLRITGLEQSRAVEKIGFTLYYLLFRYGKEIKQDIFTIDVKMSQVMIASLVGLTRESTTKNLRTLKEKGVITYSSSTYTVNKNKLESFLGEDSFRDLELP